MPERVYNPIATAVCSIALLCLYILAMLEMSGRPAGSFTHAIGIIFVISALVAVFVLPWIQILTTEGKT